MRQKYHSTQIQLACQSHSQAIVKDIHCQLQQTIAERKNILADWEKLFLDDNTNAATIHVQLKNTIANLRRAKLQYKEFFPPAPDDISAFTAKKAA